MISSFFKSKADEIAIQEGIYPSKRIFKAYSIFGKIQIRLNNQILFNEKGPQTFAKAQVKTVVHEELTEGEKIVGLLFAEEANSRKFMNYGLDYVKRENTHEYSFFDINSDNFHWVKVTGEKSWETFKQGMKSLLL